MNQGEIDRAWSHSVAELAVGALMIAKIVEREDLERAIAIVDEEILVRLALEDRPNESNWRYKEN